MAREYSHPGASKRISRRALVGAASGAGVAAATSSMLAGKALADSGRYDLLMAAPGAFQEGAGDFELFVASGADPVSLDPRKTFVGPGYSINAHAFEALAFRRELEDGTIEIYPVLAES